MSDIFFESRSVEYKRILNDRFETSVIAFLNSRMGGILYIGIDDDLTVYGVENPDETQRQIADRIKNNIRGECLGLYDIVLEKRDSKPVIKLIISSGTEKPYYLKEKGMTPDGCFIRNGSRVESMTVAMIEKAFARRTRNSLALIPSPHQDLTFEQLHIYYQEHGKRLNENFAKNLDLLTQDGKYNLNAFLLADQNSTTIKVAKFAGINKTQLVENEDYGYCSLIKSCKKVLDKLDIENKTFAKVGYPFREEKSFIDRDALREAVINAFVHNDYSDLMCPAFYIFSDRIEIVSYGGLIDGMSKEELISGCSRPRNRELMRIFRDVDLVEQLGTGMEKMMAVFTPKIFELTPNFFHAVLRPEYTTEEDTATTEKQDSTTEKTTDNRQITTEKDATTTEKQDFTTESDENSTEKTTEKIFKMIQNDPYITTKELALEFDMTDDGIFYHIKRLRLAGRITREGGKKGGHWRIN